MKLLRNKEDLRRKKKTKLIEYANVARKMNVNGFLALFGYEIGLKLRLFDGAGDLEGFTEVLR